MSDATPEPSTPLPEWALGQAMNDLDAEDGVDRDEQARRLVQDLEDERHDEYDDPDEGGEA